MDPIMILIIVLVIFEIPTCLGMGLIFKKMNLDFNKGIIPFYNKIILINKYKLPAYHLTLIFIPLIGLYTNYVIYSKICKEYNKDFLYVIELTFFPFVYNIFLGMELTQKIEENETNSDNQTKIKEKEEKKDEYIWYTKEKIKSDTVYKATRNNLNATVNIKLNKNDEIIDNKNTTMKKTKENETKCPNCGSKVSKNADICFVCGTKL